MSKIVLWVSDLPAQTEFYSLLFGVPTPAADSGFVEVADSINSVLLHALPSEYAAETPLRGQLKTQDEVAIKPVFTVASIDEAQARTAHTFATFSDHSNSYGEFTYRDAVDPEGNVIQLQQSN